MSIINVIIFYSKCHDSRLLIGPQIACILSFHLKKCIDPYILYFFFHHHLFQSPLSSIVSKQRNKLCHFLLFLDTTPLPAHIKKVLEIVYKQQTSILDEVGIEPSILCFPIHDHEQARWDLWPTNLLVVHKWFLYFNLINIISSQHLKWSKFYDSS